MILVVLNLLQKQAYYMEFFICCDYYLVRKN